MPQALKLHFKVAQSRFIELNTYLLLEPLPGTFRGVMGSGQNSVRRTVPYASQYLDGYTVIHARGFTLLIGRRKVPFTARMTRDACVLVVIPDSRRHALVRDGRIDCAIIIVKGH